MTSTPNSLPEKVFRSFDAHRDCCSASAFSGTAQTFKLFFIEFQLLICCFGEQDYTRPRSQTAWVLYGPQIFQMLQNFMLIKSSLKSVELFLIYSIVEPASLVAQQWRTLLLMQETQVWSLVRMIPWSRKWQPTPVSLPGKSHGQRSLTGYSWWGCETWLRNRTTNGNSTREGRAGAESWPTLTEQVLTPLSLRFFIHKRDYWNIVSWCMIFPPTGRIQLQ